MKQILIGLLLVMNWLLITAFAAAPEQNRFHRSELPLTVINPSPANNRMGSGFPGFRAGNQLVIYDHAYGKARTGTNEFGFEVTVINGRVVEQEGSDSLIPMQNGFVLSGYGRVRQWLIEHAPLGAWIQIDKEQKTVGRIISAETYYYQLANRLVQVKDRIAPTIVGKAQNISQNLKILPEPQVAQQAELAMALLNQTTWKQPDLFSTQAIRGAWHRPVEKSPEEVGRTLDRLQQAGINTVFLESFFHGYPIFLSQTYQAYDLAEEQNPKFKGWDPLQTWVESSIEAGGGDCYAL